MYVVLFKEGHMLLGPQYGRMIGSLGSTSTTEGIDACS
jgi:hypothetical protein